MTDQQKVRLLPCPWCGSHKVGIRGRCIECASCGSGGPELPLGGSKSDMYALWNTRQAALAHASSATTNPQESSIRLVDAEDSELLTAYKALMLAVTSAQPVWPNPWPQEVSILGYAIHGLRLDTKYAQDKITALRNRLISERTAFYSPHVHHMEFARDSAEADINEFEQAFDQAIAGRRGDGNG